MGDKDGESAAAKEKNWTYFNRFAAGGTHHPNGTLAAEIDRSRRYGLSIGVLKVLFKGRERSMIHKLMPGIPLCMEWQDLKLRNYDRVHRNGLCRYTILLPQTDIRGVSVVKNRIISLAEEKGWTHLKIGEAIYPQDGEDPETLLKRAEPDLDLWEAIDSLQPSPAE